MGRILGRVFCLIASLIVVSAYAVTVKVQTKSDKASALGFTVNNKSHGGMGRSYIKKNMPAGAAYGFGLRVGGLFRGDDVTCYTKRGHKKTVKLKKDVSVVLLYDGKQCVFQVGSLGKK